MGWIPVVLRAAIVLTVVSATVSAWSAPVAARQDLGASLFASICGAVGGAERPPPSYPPQPQPTGSGTVVTVENAQQLDDLLAGRVPTPPPGSVISVASGVYSEARWRSTGGAGIGFAGSAEHPITWYAREQHGVQVTTTSSYRAMQLNASDSHHRFIGFHLRDGHELFLSTADGTEFLHGRISGSTSGGAWKWRGVEGGRPANGMRFSYNVVTTANSGSNFGRLEGVYIGDGRNPQLLQTRQTNFEISGNCFADAPGGAIDIKANSTNGLVANNLIDSTDHISGGINALPGWHWLPSSARQADPNMQSYGNRISVQAHPSSNDSNAGAGIRVNGSWVSTNDRVTNSSNAALFVLAQADLSLTVTGLTSINNRNGAARRGGSAAIDLTSADNQIDQQGNLVLEEGSPPTTTTTTTTTRPPTTTPPTTAAPTTAPPTTTAGTVSTDSNSPATAPTSTAATEPSSSTTAPSSSTTAPNSPTPSAALPAPPVDPVEEEILDTGTAATAPRPADETVEPGAAGRATNQALGETDSSHESATAPVDTGQTSSDAGGRPTIDELDSTAAPERLALDTETSDRPPTGDLAMVQIDEQTRSQDQRLLRPATFVVGVIAIVAVGLRGRRTLEARHRSTR